MRITIRDLLWLIVVVALAAGWLTDRRHSRWSAYTWMCRAAQSAYALKQLGWSVDWTGPQAEFKDQKRLAIQLTYPTNLRLHQYLLAQRYTFALKSSSYFGSVDAAQRLDIDRQELLPVYCFRVRLPYGAGGFGA